jgi:hypothetical protein
MSLSEAENEVYRKLDAYFDLNFPIGREGPEVLEESHKSEFFAIFAEAFRAGANIWSGQISERFGSEWREKRTQEQWDDAMELCDAWDEWWYAWDKQRGERD